MRNIAVFLTLTLLALAPVSAVGQQAPAPPSPSIAGSGASPTPGATPAVQAINRVTVEARDPLAEIAMWGPLGVVGIAFAVAWVIVRKRETELEAKLGLAKEVLQAKKAAMPKADPTVTVEQFAARLETVARQVMSATMNADRSVETIDKGLTEVYSRIRELELKLQTLERDVEKRR